MSLDWLPLLPAPVDGREASDAAPPLMGCLPVLALPLLVCGVRYGRLCSRRSRMHVWRLCAFVNTASAATGKTAVDATSRAVFELATASQTEASGGEVALSAEVVGGVPG
jgi:hypothetical protein